MSLKRVDVLLKELGYASSRNRAQTMVEEGLVFNKDEKITKVSKKILKEDLRVAGELKFVGRGAFKLQAALERFPVEVAGKVCMDIGASTGGFTQVLLEKGAEKVYAVDVGKDQLAEELKKDTRVVNLENTNFRYLEGNKYFDVDLITIDVSFISLDLILPNAMNIIGDGEIIALLKPQFEGKNNTGKKNHIRLIKNKILWFQDKDFKITEIIPSPIRGKEGSVEYLLYIKKCSELINFEIESIVEKAFTINREKK